MPRRDARRNADRLREAAVAVFREHGIDAPLDEVARAAGVSIGTLYNHFPGRQHLLDAVLPDVAAAQFERIRAATGRAGTAAERLAAYLTEVVAVQADDRLLADALAGMPPPTTLPADVASACAAVLALGADLVGQARAAGTPHPVIDETGLAGLIVANSIVHRAPAPAGWDAFLAAVIAGRVPDRTRRRGSDGAQVDQDS